jgi:phosphoribosylanthranilate isomerase
MKDIKLKICGIIPGKTDEKITSMADLLGFIFYDKSPRHVDPAIHSKIKALSGIDKVGVFVNESPDRILQLIEDTGLTMVQLHGEEPPEFCNALRKRVGVIKTISVKEPEDLDVVEKYKNSVDYFLFDTRGELKGGSGIKFNWKLLKDRRFGHPFFLSGGISRQDADIIRSYEHPELAGIDINSCFETAPGLKDLPLIDDFKKELYG